MLQTITETVSFLKSRVPFEPEYGIILGTGLGGLVGEMDVRYSLSYEEIPNFPVSTVESHHGRLIFGFLGNKKVVAMQGRFHFYEGYTMEQVTFPVRVMKFLGIKALFLSNASGGLNPNFEISDIMIIDDHINLLPNPLIGRNYTELGPRFPDMSEPYDRNLIDQALTIAHALKIKIQKGCYVAVTGPSLETPKEYQYLRTIGADTVGMSTIPEVIVARHMNLKCFAVSIITDLGVPGKIRHVTLQDVLNAAGKAEPDMTRLLKELITSL
ncbi:MAG: purine-nucleoside phosphorylase [Bacteroidales bacterium]|nr:purine-nucleoside phosphorylase [Bacteroidales bacterium]